MKLLIHAILRTLLVSAAIAGATWALSIFVRFGKPERLWYVAIPCLIFACWTGYSLWRQRAVSALGDSETLASLTAQQSPIQRSVRAGLLVLSALMAVYAFAVPQWGEESRQVERRGIDVVLAVDVSRSMLADDVPPNRLQAAIGEIETLLEDLKGDRVGLVVYAGVAFTQSPLTSDYGATRLYLNRLNPANIPVQGTAIGRAIAEGKKLLTGGTNKDFKRAQHQMMIVVSDGEDHETDPITAAQEANDEGIRVFTVGVGSEDGARIPVRDENGNLREYLTDRNGQVVITKLQDDQLRDIARAGGGQYIRYSGEGSVAAELSRAVDSFDDEALSSVLRAEYVDRPMFFLIPSALSLLAFLLLGGVRRRRASIAIVALCVLSSGCSGIERDDPAVEEAVEASKNDDHERAVSEIEQANEEAREQGAYWFDRGLIHERAEQNDEALDAYLHALGAAEGGLRADSLVGIGNTLFAQEQFSEARDRYERALRLNPDHAAARRNLEIALRREFPPCRELDDEYEDNDDKDSATPIPETSLAGDFAPKGMQVPGAPGSAGLGAASGGAQEEAPHMVSCGGNDDYYAIPVHGGDLIAVTATFRRLREDTGGPPLPDEIEPTAVRLAILSPDGEEVLAVDQGLEDASEAVDAKRVSRRIENLAIPDEYGQEGAVLLLVETNQPLEFEYELEVSVIPPCRVLEDEFEENDSRSAASPLESGEHRAMACAGDPDWYSVSVDAGDDLFVDVEPGVSTTKEPVMMRASIAASPDSREMTEVATQPETLAALEARSISSSGAIPFSVAGVDDAEGQYPFSVYHYPPCPVGRDRFEPNDAVGNATPLTAEDAPVRHLRLCDGDEDWFRFTLPPEPGDEAPAGDDEDEPQPIPFSALASFDDSNRDVTVELYDAESQRLIGTSQNLRATPSGQAPVAADPLTDPTPTATEGDDVSAPATEPGESIAAALLPPGTTEVLVRVGGAQSYYHLSFPDTQAQQDQQQNGEGSDSDDSQSDGEPDDSEGDEDSQEPQDEEQNSGDESEDEAQERDAASAEQTEEEAKREALMQLLNALEDDDVNLQLQQALDDLPPVQMRNEW